MGIVLDAIGVNHKLRTDNPLSLFQELSEMHHVNIEVIYELDLEEELRYESVYKLDAFDREKSAFVVLPECDYLTAFYQKKKSFAKLDWQSKELKSILLKEISTHNNPYLFSHNGFEGTEIYHHHLYLDVVNETHNFSVFCSVFQGSEKTRKEDFDLILLFRQKVKSECEKWGCDFAVYFPSYGEKGADLYNHLGVSKEELMSLIQKEFSKRDSLKDGVFVDISTFIMSNQSPFSSDTKLNVFMDDFMDLK